MAINNGPVQNLGQATSIAGNANDMMVEQIVAATEYAFNIRSVFAPRVTENQLVGTNIAEKRSIGEAVTMEDGPGSTEEMKTQTLEQARRVTVLDTRLYARMQVKKLDMIQDPMTMNMKFAKRAGNAMSLDYDSAVLGQLIKGSKIVAGSGAGEVAMPKGHVGGITADITAANLADPDLLEKALRGLVRDQNKRHQEVTGRYFLIGHDLFDTLIESNKLIESTFSSGNGHFAGYTMFQLAGIPLVVTNRMDLIAETPAGTHAKLSNAANGNRYDYTAEMASCKALLVGDEAAWVNRALSIEGKKWYDDRLETEFTNVDQAFSADYDRADNLAGLFEV